MLAVWALCNLALRDASRQSMWEDAETRDALLGSPPPSPSPPPP